MKLWNSSNIIDINSQNKTALAAFTYNDYLPESNFRVAIVGGGPKGAYSIERLASVWEKYNPGKFLDIVCFNKTSDFASGPNYQTEQPDFLLMNYNLGKVDFWTKEEEQLVHDRPDLLTFLRRFKKPSEVEVEPSDYCSRSLTGIYLQFCLNKVIEALPSTIRLHLIMDEVDSISQESNNLQVETKRGMKCSFSEVMCCTGHAYSFEEKVNLQSPIGNSKFYPPTILQSVYPIQELRDQNFAGLTVAVKGMGLTFVDAVLTMTEGKGGCFKRCNGKLVYRSSGRGPHEVLPFSRTGLPMIARQVDLRNGDFSLKFFTEIAVEELLENNTKLDFKSQLLPLLENEYRYQYAKKLLSWEIGRVDFLEKKLEELEARVGEFYPEFEPFELEKFLSPDLPLDNQHLAVIDYLHETIFPERFDKLHQAKILMSSLWREIYPLFNSIYSFGKLTGESQRYFDQNYFGKFQRVAYGPPKENMEKILALSEVGILNFDLAANPKVSIQNQYLYAKLSNQQIPHSKIISALIDARIPKSVGLVTQPEYIKNIIKEIGVDFFRNEEYQTGCLEIGSDGRLLKQKHICFYGTPTEGYTLDNESLSRSNNNFLSPWTKKIIENYVNINLTKANPNNPTLDQGHHKRSESTQ
ncbi:FAD/NAD(P)-binding protein [Belliella sp. R4-6]|uniref:FAD/NAD(P)-binding protein n=1 Tax=Belliella alkalica TaxID=1730871 RepID=A0ABS9V7T7_9BACT|nr:FAD/NAD(P)-binding domain-containing protein [Belliella alkalica]MCH7412477.1 FAD/NAD(P)-binding protein [Belliella alkalica]